jgi:eukaryotic-like serine/threonine-protein kinase
LRFVADSRDRLLSGRYRLIDQIGRGGMGTVWWAHDEVENREVAVKEVHLPNSLDERAKINLIRRTDREARSAGRIRHPGLVAMYDVVVEDSRPWLVMEYVAGRSLESVFSEDGPISPLRVAEIGRQLLSALRAAHAAGIVHRDVKPSNVLLEGSGRVVLTDFGIATYDGATTLTQTGTFMGSPAYVAPEAARGERATPASDLWSLGATLYAAVEGRPPYAYETAMATLSALVTSEPTPPVRAGALTPLLEGLLRKDPARRLTGEAAAELLAAVIAPPARPSEPSPRPRLRDRPWAAPALAIVVLALAVGSGVLVGLNNVRRSPAATPTRPPPASTAPAARPGLPATMPATSRLLPSRRVARGGGTWPASATRTFGVVRRGRARLGVLVICRPGERRLSFTAYVASAPRRAVRGTCAEVARPGAVAAPLVLPAGAARRLVRVTVRPARGGGPVVWQAGVYQEVR